MVFEKMSLMIVEKTE